MTDALQQEVEEVQQLILSRYPDTKFKFQPSPHGDIWHLSVYTPQGNIQIPVDVATRLNMIWQKTKVTVITVVYPMGHYKEEAKMAEVSPFQGLRYSSPAGELALLLAPPYDVIGPEEQRQLHQQSPYNIIRLELGETSPQDTPEDSRYTRARRWLKQWAEDGVLTREGHPAYYLVRHGYNIDGQEGARWELLAQVRLEDWDRGVVLPHEHTLPEPKVDRMSLLRATLTNISPVYGLYDDRHNILGVILKAQTTDNPPVADIAGWRNASFTMWTVTDPLVIERIERFFATAKLYIADGHHRYETALAYRNEQRAAHPEVPAGAGFNYLMMSLTSLQDPGLRILPIHRVVRGLDSALLDGLGQQLRDEWNVEYLPLRPATLEADLAAVVTRLQSHIPAPAFALYGLEPGQAALITPRDEAALRARIPVTSDPLRELDLSLLHAVILHGYLQIGRSPQEVEAALGFTHEAHEAVELVGRGQYQLAVLVNPTRVEQMVAVAEQGEKMPQKSTFFYPKLPTGLVLRPLQDVRDI